MACSLPDTQTDKPLLNYTSQWSQGDQKNDHCDGNTTSKEILAMITTVAGRDQKNDRSDGNTGSKEIFRMIAMVAMLYQKKISFMKQACSAFFIS